MMTRKNNSLSTHEKICAERMKTLIRTIDEIKIQLKDMSVEIKDLRVDMSKGKGAIMLLIILGGVIGTLISIFKFWR
jgi:hypothetical protein